MTTETSSVVRELAAFVAADDAVVAASGVAVVAAAVDVAAATTAALVRDVRVVVVARKSVMERVKTEIGVRRERRLTR